MKDLHFEISWTYLLTILLELTYLKIFIQINYRFTKYYKNCRLFYFGILFNKTLSNYFVCLKYRNKNSFVVLYFFSFSMILKNNIQGTSIKKQFRLRKTKDNDEGNFKNLMIVWHKLITETVICFQVFRSWITAITN